MPPKFYALPNIVLSLPDLLQSTSYILESWMLCRLEQIQLDVQTHDCTFYRYC